MSTVIESRPTDGTLEPGHAPRQRGNGLRDIRQALRAIPGLPLAVAVLASALLAQILLALAAWLTAPPPPWLAPLQIATAAAALLAAAWFVRQVSGHLTRPLEEVRRWAQHLRRGGRGSSIATPVGQDTELAAELTALTHHFQRLGKDLDEEVRQHTERLAQKTRSLQILYDVAASVNTARDMDDLLTRFLHTLIELVDARAGVVRLLTDDGQMRLVASIGLEGEVLEREKLVPMTACMCGVAVGGDSVLIESDATACRQHLGRSVVGGKTSTVIAIPLQYRGSNLGVYNLFLDHRAKPGDDLKELLLSIGRHLGVAIEKSQLDTKAQRLSIMQERTMLAHELHDSVAQTIASLRYRVRALDEILPADAPQEARQEILQIRNTLDEAHTELRELMVHYRAPVDDRGLLPAIEELVERFRRETNIALFLQKDCGGSNLPAILELQVLRIIQEALANVRKHSKAHVVRVLMRCVDGEYYRVLIEDDGVGFTNATFNGRPGEHVGLSIMQERSQRLGGTLRIESEPGEGTRVELSFRHCKEAQFAPPIDGHGNHARIDH